MRELIEKIKPPGRPDYSPAEYFTEMISAGALCAGGPFEAWYADNEPCPEKLVYQLTGNNADQLAAAAEILNRNRCLGFDINMGCSAPAIVRTGAGVRWMADIDRAGSLIAKVRRAVPNRLSVKLRTGLNDDFEYLVRFCKNLEKEGVEMITLHPRTAKEKFRRSCRWNYIRELRKELKIPVAGNGDIKTAEELLAKSADCDAVMSGRAAIQQPWIFAKAAALFKKEEFTVPPVKETGLLFLELLSKYQPPEFHLSRARRFFEYFCENLKWRHYVKTQLNRETTLSGIEKVWKEFDLNP